MYTVYLDGQILYDPRVDELKIHDPSILLEVNKTNGFDFTIYPSHPLYARIKRFLSVVEVYQDNAIIFRGRVLNDDLGFYNEKHIICEGDLAFFNDSIIRPYVYQGDIRGFLTKIINEHNAQVDPTKQFKLGNITVENTTDYIYRSSVNGAKSWKVLTEKLINLLGGFIMVRRSNNVNYIDYLADSNYRSQQTIELGKNLLDLKRKIKGEDICTALIPYGARIEDEEGGATDERVTIEAVNGGVDYVYDQDAVDLYGWVFDTKTWDDVTINTNLLRKAKEELGHRIKLQVSIDLNAIDLSMMNADIDKFRIFEYVKVDSPTHLLEDYMLVSKMTIDMLRPENNKLTLGLDYATFTERQLQTENAIEDITTIKGPKGDAGKTNYTWIKYADDDKGSNMSDSPRDKLYIGLAFNKETPNESTDPSDYQWSVMPQNIEAGGANLIRNFYSPMVIVNGTIHSEYDVTLNTSGNSINFYFYEQSEEVPGAQPLQPNTDYVFQVHEGDASLEIGAFYNKGANTIIPWTNEKKIKFNTGSREDIRLIIRSTADNQSVGKVSLYRGSLAFDWSLAPEDVATSDYVTEQVTTLDSNIEQTAEAIRTEVSEEYTAKSEFETYQEAISTQFEQTSNTFDFTFNELIQQISELDGETRTQFEEITKYIRFIDGRIVLGEVGNELTLELSNDRISFLQNDVEVAYINNNQMTITEGEFLHSLRIGNFAYLPRENGSLDFKKVVN